MANEGIVESGLPFLDDGHFKTAIAGTFCIDWDGCPNVQVVVFSPVAQCKLSLYKSFIGELKVFPGAAVLSVHDMVHCRAHVEFGLH